MATQAALILKVRRGVKDFYTDPEDALYSDEYYVDAIEDAIARYNSDISADYTILTIPAAYTWVLVLLAKITMCEIRAMESNNSDGATGAAIRTQVPGLEIWHQPQKETIASDWLKLCKLLEDKYQKHLEDIGADVATLPYMTVLTASRENLRRGRSTTRREVAVALPALSDVTLTLDDSDVVLTWTTITDTQFGNYRIERSDDGLTFTTIGTVYDIHIGEFTDDAILPAATYTYQVVLVNKTGLESISNQVTNVVL